MTIKTAVLGAVAVVGAVAHACGVCLHEEALLGIVGGYSLSGWCHSWWRRRRGGV